MGRGDFSRPKREAEASPTLLLSLFRVQDFEFILKGAFKHDGTIRDEHGSAIRPLRVLSMWKVYGGMPSLPEIAVEHPPTDDRRDPGKKP